MLVHVARFRATTFRDLERHARRVPWHRFAAAGSPVAFQVTARKSKLYHSDAIAERLYNAMGAGPSTPSPQLFVVRMHRDICEISADSSGDLLHRRGYRQAVTKAPMRETLAAALLLAADWNGTTPLMDPLCGSGTVVIEGALLARRMAPGAQREFAFTRWPDFDTTAWRRQLDEASAGAMARAPVPIFGSDRDAGAIAMARANAERAGVSADIEFSRTPLSAIQPPRGPGLLATNPPYGVRASAGSDLRDLYATLGNVARERCAGWRVALLTPNARLSAQTQLPLKPVARTANGGIRVAISVAEVRGARPP